MAAGAVDVHEIAEKVIRDATATSHRTLTVLRCNVLLLGDAAVGKTSLVAMIERGEFLKSYAMTNVPEPHIIPVPVEGNPDMRVELNVIDVCGKTVFYPFDTGESWWASADAVLLMYDVSNRDSFTSLAKWLRRLLEQRGARPLLGFVVANKTDLPADRVAVAAEDAAAFAESISLGLASISIKDGVGVDVPLKGIAQQVHRAYEERVAATIAAVSGAGP